MLLDGKKLADILEQQGHKNLILNARDYAQLNELIDILDPFLEATHLTESEKSVSISFALPSILSLITHLNEMLRPQRLKYCSPIAKALLVSIKKRFNRNI